MILSLSLASDAWMSSLSRVPELYEPSSFDVTHWSVLPNDLSLGSVCCDEATIEALPAVASSEGLYDTTVCHEGLYDVSEETF